MSAYLCVWLCVRLHVCLTICRFIFELPGAKSFTIHCFYSIESQTIDPAPKWIRWLSSKHQILHWSRRWTALNNNSDRWSWPLCIPNITLPSSCRDLITQCYQLTPNFTHTHTHTHAHTRTEPLAFIWQASGTEKARSYHVIITWSNPAAPDAPEQTDVGRPENDPERKTNIKTVKLRRSLQICHLSILRFIFCV